MSGPERIVPQCPASNAASAFQGLPLYQYEDRKVVAAITTSAASLQLRHSIARV